MASGWVRDPPGGRMRGRLPARMEDKEIVAMPKKNAKAQQKSNELDGAEFFAAIDLIEKEKGIPKA